MEIVRVEGQSQVETHKTGFSSNPEIAIERAGIGALGIGGSSGGISIGHWGQEKAGSQGVFDFCSLTPFPFPKVGEFDETVDFL